MKIVYTPTERARERVMAFGGIAVGKTTVALQIAAKVTGDVYVIDADNAWERQAPLELVREEHHIGGEVESHAEDGNLIIHHVRGWKAQEAAMTRVMGQVRRDDWVVVDSSSVLWDDIAKWYIQEVHGKDLPDFLLQHRLSQAQGGKKATQGQDAMLIEWSFINGLWHRVVTEPLTWAPCHVLVLAESGEIRSDGRDSKQIKTTFSDVGSKPRTQKGLAFAMQTVLFLERNSMGDYKMTTVKDREDSRGARAPMEREPWSNFVTSYLKGRAGWQMEKR